MEHLCSLLATLTDGQCGSLGKPFPGCSTIGADFTDISSHDFTLGVSPPYNRILARAGRASPLLSGCPRCPFAGVRLAFNDHAKWVGNYEGLDNLRLLFHSLFVFSDLIRELQTEGKEGV